MTLRDAVDAAVRSQFPIYAETELDGGRTMAAIEKYKGQE